MYGWAIGATIVFAGLTLQQRRFIHSLGLLASVGGNVYRAAGSVGCPAIVGLLRPRIVVPVDFDTRYTTEERELILAHERMHLRRADLVVNALLAGARCIFWFNPLVHWADRLVRFDQELACDAAVLRELPKARRTYANAMLKTQLVAEALPLGSHWSARHPLKERIMRLQSASPGRVRAAVGLLAVVVLVVAGSYGARLDRELLLEHPPRASSSAAAR
jgi:beta-lactamase regulating signal transducer with metallopeptidase domain